MAELFFGPIANIVVVVVVVAECIPAKLSSGYL